MQERTPMGGQVTTPQVRFDNEVHGDEPLLKWPGGKRSLLRDILPLIPTTYKHYYEPFFGGGAMFFRLQPAASTLADTNADLMECYTQIRDDPSSVVIHLSRMRNTKEDYYVVRDSVPDNPPARAARMIYLATLAFNGIYRVNLQGRFNVPYGQKTHLQPCNPARVYAASAALSGSILLTGDFGDSLKAAKAGDLVYLDPPYTTAHGENGFLKYNAHIFSWEDQLRLSTLAAELVDRGCSVLVSNADHASIRALYNGFKLRTIRRFSRIAASSKARAQVSECVFYSGGD